LSISANRHPTLSPPPQIDGFVVQTYALCFAQTTSPPEISKAIAELVKQSIEKTFMFFWRNRAAKWGFLGVIS
jgi:hypothetical protein